LNGKHTEVIKMAYSKKVVDKFEDTLNNPQAFKVGRFDPAELNVD